MRTLPDPTPKHITLSLSRREAEAVMDLIAGACDRVTRPVMPPRVAAAEHHASRLLAVLKRSFALRVHRCEKNHLCLLGKDCQDERADG